MILSELTTADILVSWLFAVQQNHHLMGSVQTVCAASQLSGHFFLNIAVLVSLVVCYGRYFNIMSCLCIMKSTGPLLSGADPRFAL